MFDSQRKTFQHLRTEKSVEDADRKRLSEEGALVLKFVVPGRNGYPDRLVLAQVPEKHRALIARYVQFIEYKRPGKKKADAHQNRKHKKLRDLGFHVEVRDVVSL